MTSNQIRLLPLLLLGAGLLVSSCMPRINRYYPPADTLAFSTYDVDEYAEKYDGHDGVYIDKEYNVEHHLAGQDWIGYAYSRLRFIILNEDAEWITTFRVRIDPGEELEDAWVVTMAPDGAVTRYGVKDFTVDEVSNGSKIYRFAYPEIEVGTVVDEGFDIRYRSGSDLANFEMPLQYSVPVERVRVRYAYPTSFSVKSKKTGPEERLDFDYENPRSGKAITYEARDLPAVAEEPYSPYFKNMADFFEVSVTAIYSNTFIASWSDYADDFVEFAVDREARRRNRVGDKVEEIVDDSMSDAEKFAAIVGWVQQNIEIAFEYDDRTDFDDVLKEEKGNPFLINGLTRLMLEKAGIDAIFLLVHDGSEGYFDEDYIIPGALTDPAVYAKIDGREYVAVPHRKNFPTDLIPREMQGQRAMKIDEEGFAGFVTLPFGDSERNIVNEVFRLDITEEGVIRVEEENRLDGSLAYFIRRLLEEAEGDELEEVMEGMITYEEGEVELDSWDVENGDDYTKPLILKITYHIDNLVTITPEEVIVQTGGLLSAASATGTKVESEKRINPIKVFHDERLVKEITLRYPSSWNLATELPKTSVENKFGSLEADYETVDGVTTIRMSRTLNRLEAPAEEFTEMIDLLSRRSRYFDVPTLIFDVR